MYAEIRTTEIESVEQALREHANELEDHRIEIRKCLNGDFLFQLCDESGPEDDMLT